MNDSTAGPAPADAAPDNDATRVPTGKSEAMNGSSMRLVRWLVVLFVVAGLLLPVRAVAAQEDDECLPEDAAALLDPNGDLLITPQELEEFVAFLQTIDPADYPGDLQGDIAEVQGVIDWMYGNDVTSIEYVICQAPEPTVPPEVTPEPTLPPVVTPEPTVPPQVTPEPTTPPYVEPESTVAPPSDEPWEEPEVVEPAEEAVPVVAQSQPIVVALPSTGTGTGMVGDSVTTRAVVLIVTSGALGLLATTLRVRSLVR